jgi:hypothetical protein
MTRRALLVLAEALAVPAAVLVGLLLAGVIR